MGNYGFPLSATAAIGSRRGTLSTSPVSHTEGRMTTDQTQDDTIKSVDMGRPEPIDDVALPPADKPIDEIVADTGTQINLPPENMTSGIVSPAGEIFDPEIHCSSSSITKQGYFRRKSGSPKVQRIGVHKNGQQNTEGNVEQNRQLENAGFILAGVFFGIGCGILGPDFIPENKAEKETVEIAINNYMSSLGLTDIPPGIALVITLVGYTASKYAQKESVRKTWKERIIEPFKKMIGKK
jgi:hypothetical protein